MKSRKSFARMGCVCAVLVLPLGANAQDATWSGPGRMFSDAANWSTGALPTGTAIFGAGGPFDPLVMSSVTMGEVRFQSTAPPFVVTLGEAPTATSKGTPGGLRLNGAGITDLSGKATFRIESGLLTLGNQASLGTAIVQGGTGTRDVVLLDNSRGGSAKLDNLVLVIQDSASAENLALTNGQIQLGSSRPGLATLGTATVSIASIPDANGANDFSFVASNATLGAANITILDGPKNLLRAVARAEGGTASINVLGTGRFDVSGVSAPNFTIGSLTGDGRVIVGSRSNFALVLNGTGGTFGGTFEGGGGAQVQFGNGTYSLTGTSPFAGNYAAEGTSRLFVDGNIGAAQGLSVASQATLGGNGTLPTTTVAGTLSPGRSIGTLTVAGDLNMASGATTVLEVDPATGASDRVNVSGNATLTGSSAQVVSLGSTLPQDGQRFTVLTAGSITGGYKTVSDTLPYFDFKPAYTPTQLDLVANRLPFDNPVATDNARNLQTQSAALDAYVATTAVASTPPTTPSPTTPVAAPNSDFDKVLDQLLFIPTASQATAALHSMSGEAYASFTTVGLEQLDRFRYATLDAAGSCEQRGGQVRGRFCGWADGYYNNSTLDGKNDLAGFDYTLSGVQAGLETWLQPGSMVGATFGYGAQRMSDFEYASRRFDGDALNLGIYGAQDFGPWRALGFLGYTRFDVDAQRDVAVGNINRQARSSFNGDGLNTALALRYRAEVSGVALEPEALIAYSQYWQGGLTEAGADSLNLRVDRTDANSFVTGIGIRASTNFMAGGSRLRPYALLRYERDWLAGSDDDHQVTASFASVPEAGYWTMFGQNRGRDNLIGALGLVADITPQVSLFGSMAGQWNNNGSEWGVTGGVRVSF